MKMNNTVSIRITLPPLTGSGDHCQGSARNTLSAVLTLTAVVEANPLNTLFIIEIKMNTTHCKNSFRNTLMLLLGGVMLCTSCKKDSGVTGDCTWTLTGAVGDYTLTIAGNGAMGNYSSDVER
jgi:hypothetical protein